MGLKIFITVITLALFACSQNSPVGQDGRQTNPDNSLASAYRDYFLIGAAVDETSYQTHSELLIKQFNSITTENEMKFESLQPLEDQFNFETADAMLNFARQNHMATRGHALVWHRQTPDWVFYQEDGTSVSPAVLRQRMKNHIFTVMQHFQGKIDVWDVVNEAVTDDGRLRTHLESGADQKSAWFGILGESYIEDAFVFARQADPQAKLFYNDYYNYIPARREAIYQLLKKLLAKGIPIDGVGLQCHINIQPSTNPNHQSYHQTIENLEKAIQMYASLGLDVQITELDISAYVAGEADNKEDFYTVETFSPALQALQAERFKALFAMFRRNSKAISNVTFWGVADDSTWLSEFGFGRQDFPMLFDIHHKPKPAYDAVVNF